MRLIQRAGQHRGIRAATLILAGLLALGFSSSWMAPASGSATMATGAKSIGFSNTRFKSTGFKNTGGASQQCGGANHNNPFGSRSYTIGADSGHDHNDIWNRWSTDLWVPHGTVVQGTCHGTVEFAGRDRTGWGNIVVVRDASTNQCWLYAHLDSVSVSVDDEVEAGTALGRVGRSGNADHSHLHLSLHYCYPNSNRVGYGARWKLQDRPATPISANDDGPLAPVNVRLDPNYDNVLVSNQDRNPPPVTEPPIVEPPVTEPPVAGCGGAIHTNPYGQVDYKIVQGPGGTYTHSDAWNRYAYDLVAPHRTPISATCDGVVMWAGLDPVGEPRGGWGRMVVVQDGSTGQCWLYGHFDAILVSAGDQVGAGTTLGLQGNTGNSLGSHLHLSLHDCNPSYRAGAGFSVPWTLQ